MNANTPAEPRSHLLRGDTGLSRACARRSLGARDAAYPRLPVLRSPAGGFVFRLVRVSAHRFHPAVGRIADHLDLPRRESVVSAHQRPVPRISGGIRSRGARAPARILTAFPQRSAGARRHPGLDRLFYRERRELERARAAAGQPAAQPRLRPLRRHRRNRSLVRTVVHELAPGQDRRADPLQHRDPAGAGAAACIGARTPTKFRIGFAVVGRPARRFPQQAWQRYEQTIVKPNVEPRPAGAYATAARRRRRSGCPVHAE